MKKPPARDLPGPPLMGGMSAPRSTYRAVGAKVRCGVAVRRCGAEVRCGPFDTPYPYPRPIYPNTLTPRHGCLLGKLGVVERGERERGEEDKEEA